VGTASLYRNGKLIIENGKWGAAVSENRDTRALRANGKLIMENGEYYVLETARSVAIIFNSPAGGRGLDTISVKYYKWGEYMSEP
jgi:hypothetical protein